MHTSRHTKTLQILQFNRVFVAMRNQQMRKIKGLLENWLTNAHTKNMKLTAGTAPPDVVKIRRKIARQWGSSGCVCECRG